MESEMETAKDAVRQILDKMPEDSSFDDIMYHIYVQEKIRRGLDEVREGNVLSQEEAEKRLSKWLGK